MDRQFSVSAEKLLHAVKVLELVPSVVGFPSSSFVRLEHSENRLSMSLSAEVRGQVSVKGSGDLRLKKPIFCARGLLFPFVSVAAAMKSEKPFVFSLPTEGLKDKRLRVERGKRKAVFDCADSGAGYSQPTSGKWSELSVSEELADRMQVVATCANDESVPELNCVYLRVNGNVVSLFSSNQLLVMQAKDKAKGKLPSALALPLFVVSNMKADGVKEVRLYEKAVALQFDCGFVWQAISVKAQEGFPMKRSLRVIEEGMKQAKQFSVKTSRLAIITERFGQYLSSAKRDNWELGIEGREGDSELRLEASVPQGVFRERMRIEEPAGSSFRFVWPLNVLLPLIGLLSKEDSVLEVRFSEKSPFLLSADGYSAVLARGK